MSAAEVELGVVEPDPVDPRVDEVERLIDSHLIDGWTAADTAAAVVDLLDERAAEAAAELEA